MMFRKKKDLIPEQTEEKRPLFLVTRWKNLKKATTEDEEKFRRQMQENKVGFKDGLAMTLAAFLVIVLPVALILTGSCLLVMWLLGVL